jgi:hypothetical protein
MGKETATHNILHTQEEVDKCGFAGFFWFEAGGFWICRASQSKPFFAFPPEFDPENHMDERGGISIAACARWLQSRGFHISANILLRDWHDSVMGVH